MSIFYYMFNNTRLRKYKSCVDIYHVNYIYNSIYIFLRDKYSDTFNVNQITDDLSNNKPHYNVYVKHSSATEYFVNQI